MKALAHGFLKFTNNLSILEWIAIITVGVAPILAIRVVSMFYVGLVIFVSIFVFLTYASWDYLHSTAKKQREKKARHYSQVAIYLFASFVMSILYLAG